MRVHVLQHVAFEGLGSIATWLAQQPAQVSYTRFFADEVLPNLQGLDLIIVLGGPMSVNDHANFTWLSSEQTFIAAAIAQGTAVLGICLGAQLIARALGARVYPNESVEIGYSLITAPPVAATLFQLPATLSVLHWHGETFDLPVGAIHLASSARCRHQAFQLGTRVLALQFHLEANASTVTQLLQHCADDLTRLNYSLSSEDWQRGTEQYAATSNACMAKVLQYLTRTQI